jgi:hypothetical protein
MVRSDSPSQQCWVLLQALLLLLLQLQLRLMLLLLHLHLKQGLG